MDREQQPLQFSLRDLFVAMAVIALLIVVVSRVLIIDARVPTRGNTCRNNLRNCLLALVGYEANKGQYPGYNNDLDPTTVAVPDNDRSWTFVILPYMDYRRQFDQLRQNHTPNQYNGSGNLVPGGVHWDLPVFHCPSIESKQWSKGAISYVVNTGQLDTTATATRPADFPENGVFHTGVQRSPGEKLTTMSASYIAANDGLGTTLLVSENVDARSWTDTAERWVGFTWNVADGQPGAPGQYPLQPLGINVQSGQSKTQARQNNAPGYARPSSNHPGGVNVGFCDAHVRFISNHISYRVYQALMTPRGVQAVDNSAPAATPLPTGHAATLAVKEEQIE